MNTKTILFTVAFIATMVVGDIWYWQTPAVPPSPLAGVTVLQPTGGGTGSTTLAGILIGNGTSAVRTLTIGSNLTLSGTTLSAAAVGDHFTHTSVFGQTTSATSTLLALTGTPVSLAASSTAWFDQIKVGTTTSGNLSTSTFAGGVSLADINQTGSATSTFNWGIDLTNSGCFSITGTCLQTYIQNAAAYKSAVNYATAAVLPGTPSYSNGVAGVGATLTEVGFGALAVDGQTVTLGQRILVKNESDQTTNGIYTVSTVGSGIASYLLTRSTDYNTTNDIYAGTTVPVLAGGTANADTQWTETTTGTIVVGTSNIAFEETSYGTSVVTSVTGSGNISSSGGFTPNITFTGILPIANGGTNAGAQTANQLTFYNGTALVSASSTAVTNGGLYVGLGTTTPRWLLNLASSTAPQLTLSSASLTDNPWSFRVAPGGVLYLATSSPASPFATSTAPAITIDANGSTTIKSLIVTGATKLGTGLTGAVSASAGDIIAGTLSVPNGGTGAVTITGCLTGNGTGAITGSGTCVTSVTGSGNISSSGGATPNITFTGILPIANGGTNASSFTSGQLSYFNGTSEVSASTTAVSNAGGWLGIGTTTPRHLVDLASSTAAQLCLSDASLTNSPFCFRAMPSGFAFATSSTSTFGTSTSNIFSVDANGSTTIKSLMLTNPLMVAQGGLGTAAGITGLILGNGLNAVSAYGGVTCTNQALTALSASGASTCTSITDSFFSGALAVAHGGTNVTALSASSLLAADSAGTSVIGTSTIGFKNFFATSTISNSAIAGNLTIGSQITPLLGTPLTISSSSTSTIMALIQNTNNGTGASGDLLVEGNNGTYVSYFGDFGCNSSGNTDTTFTIAAANDCYLYSTDSVLAIGTATSSATASILKFFTGGSLSANERMRITSTGLVGIGTTTPFGYLSVNAPAGTTWPFSIGSSTQQVFAVNNNNTAVFGGNVGYVISSSTAPAANNIVNWTNGATQRYIVTAATTFDINSTSSNPADGGRYILSVCQDNTGGRAVTFPSANAMRWYGTGQATTTVNTTAAWCTDLNLIYNGTYSNYHVVASSTGPMR